MQVLVEPDDGTRALTGAIRDAGRSIWLTMYMLTNRTIIHDLEYAHAAGVAVRVILIIIPTNPVSTTQPCPLRH
ncbi:MAG: hypothetical protein M3Y74_09775 [Chloroflexota bacterium]|nr:hypothetical protein [Chloroflexota bacterium]